MTVLSTFLTIVSVAMPLGIWWYVRKFEQRIQDLETKARQLRYDVSHLEKVSSASLSTKIKNVTCGRSNCKNK